MSLSRCSAIQQTLHRHPSQMWAPNNRLRESHMNKHSGESRTNTTCLTQPLNEAAGQQSSTLWRCQLLLDPYDSLLLFTSLTRPTHYSRPYSGLEFLHLVTLRSLPIQQQAPTCAPRTISTKRPPTLLLFQVVRPNKGFLNMRWTKMSSSGRTFTCQVLAG